MLQNRKIPVLQFCLNCSLDTTLFGKKKEEETFPYFALLWYLFGVESFPYFMGAMLSSPRKPKYGTVHPAEFTNHDGQYPS